jgi:elongation factor Ts
VEITLDQIKELREASGAGVMDCKRALEASDGDVEKAKKYLTDQGLASAAKKAHRETAQGVVESYIHAGGRIGALVEVNCETDFVARTEEFQGLVREIAMQIAAMNPLAVSDKDELPAGAEQRNDEVVLLNQAYIRDGSKTVKDLINETIGKTGENIQVRRFQRFELGASG